MMFMEHVELAVLDGREAAFEAALCEVRQRVFMSRGFRGFAVAQGVVERPSTYWVQVLWESPEELAEFVGSRFEGCWAPVDPFLAGAPRVSHFVERPGLALKGPGVISDLAWLSE
jgi:heme-degrading monooxygenase HmoA